MPTRPFPRSLPPALPAGRVYGAVLAATAAVAALALAGLPLGGTPGLMLLSAAVLLTGMPHGAIDHLVARRLFGLRDLRGYALFYGAYLACMAVYSLGWWVWPKGALALFVLMTMYHFGQADLAYLASARRGPRTALYLSRGLFVIGSPLLAHPGAIASVLEAIAGIAPPPVPPWWPAACVGALAVQHGGVLWAATRGAGLRASWKREGAAVLVLAGLFVAAPPLAAFAVYFGLWHALGHVLVLLRFFRAQKTEPGKAGKPGRTEPGKTGPREDAPRPSGFHAATPRSLRAFYRQAALYTLLPLGGLGALVLLAPAQALTTADVLAALFVLISVLTLPHMLLVERLYRFERRRYASSEKRGSRRAGRSR